MCVFGDDCFVFEWSGRTCSVSPFTDTLGEESNVPVCDIAVAYDAYTDDIPETYILIFRNSLVIPDMDHNLVPPFIIREGGHKVNETPKFQLQHPSDEDHCILLNGADSSVRIPMHLNGIFSFFHTRKPTLDEVQGCRKIIMTPDSSSWDPYCTSFALNEESMTNHKGNLQPPERRDRILHPGGLANVSSIQFNRNIDRILDTAFIPSATMSSQPSCIFASQLSERAEISKMIMNLGATNVASPASDILFTTSAIHAGSSSGVTKDFLSKIWMVSEDHAQRAIDQNTQLCRHQGENHLSRNYSTNDRMLRYKRLKSTFYTDTLFSSVKSIPRQNTCAQLFVSDKGFVAIYPMRSQAEFSSALHWFCKEVGVASTMIMDGHKAQVNSDTRRFCNQVGTILRKLEVGTPWANRAELYIGIMKEAVRKDLRRSDSPLALWDYCMERRATIHNSIPRELFQANGLSPHEVTFGEQGDISNICTFDWYEWVYYKEPNSYPNNREVLGRVLGPIKNEGNEMAQAVLTAKGTIVPRRTIRALTKAELVSEVERRKQNVFTEMITKKLGNSSTKSPKPMSDYIPYSDGELDPITYTPKLTQKDITTPS